tara:strand:- start:506 stop:748 length:243 start_codon:yes stop_codon:yes gene_type:complete
MSKIGWIVHEIEDTEKEVDVLCSRYFISCEHHWTEDKDFILELKGLVSTEAYPFIVENVEESWQEFLSELHHDNLDQRSN